MVAQTDKHTRVVYRCLRNQRHYHLRRLEVCIINACAPRIVSVHIRRLRKAINDGDKPDLIRTVRSAGYALDQPTVVN